MNVGRTYMALDGTASTRSPVQRAVINLETGSDETFKAPVSAIQTPRR